MKKIFALILSAAMLVSLAACGKKDETQYTTSPLTKETEAPTVATEDGGEDPGNPGVTQTNAGADAIVLLPGELYQFDKDAAGGPSIVAITVKGNQLGSAEFNDKDPDVSGLRCFFQLNEWVEFYLDPRSADSLKVYVFKHSDDAKVYTEMSYDDNDKVLATCDLAKPEEMSEQWGAFYLNPVDADPGVYDIVFVKGGKAVAAMEAKFFKEGDLTDKSDDDLRAMMKNF